MAGLPKDRNEALQVVWRTMIVIRQQLNKALGCNLRSGDLQQLTDMVMDKMYPRKKQQKAK